MTSFIVCNPLPPNYITVVKSSWLRWVGHVARMGRKEISTGFWRGDLKEGDHLEAQGKDGRIILKCIRKE